jgi:hypothetical protein
LILVGRYRSIQNIIADLSSSPTQEIQNSSTWWVGRNQGISTWSAGNIVPQANLSYAQTSSDRTGNFKLELIGLIGLLFVFLRPRRSRRGAKADRLRKVQRVLPQCPLKCLRKTSGSDFTQCPW